MSSNVRTLTGPYSGRDARVRFSDRPLPSNRADFLKTLQISLYFLKYTSASRKRVTHTKQMKLRDKGSIVSTTHYVFKCLQTCQRKAFNSNVLVWFRSLSRSFICSVCVTLLREALVYFSLKGLTLSEPHLEPSDVTCFTSLTFPNRADFLKTLQISSYFLETS